jgi:hypothetical protein
MKGQEGRESIHALKVPRQCPLVLPVKVNLKERKTVGSDVRKFYEVEFL